MTIPLSVDVTLPDGKNSLNQPDYLLIMNLLNPNQVKL